MADDSQAPTQQDFDFGEAVGDALKRVHEVVDPAIEDAIEELHWTDE